MEEEKGEGRPWKWILKRVFCVAHLGEERRRKVTSFGDKFALSQPSSWGPIT